MKIKKSRQEREAYNKAWAKAHPDRVKAYARKTYLKHREHTLAKQRAKYAALSVDERRKMHGSKPSKEVRKRYQERHQERIAARGRAWYNENLPKVLWAAAKRRAARFGLPFDIEPSDIVIPRRCPVFGVEFTGAVGEGPRPTSPTLDRIHPEMGYVRGNIAVISKRANDIKSYGTAAEHCRVAEWLDAVW
jgi:hypothetical protein